MRVVRPESIRPNDIIRLKASRSGKRVVVFERTVHSDTVAVMYRRIVGKDARRISDVEEGITYLSRRILQPLEGIWEGETLPGSPGRVVAYSNGRYSTPTNQRSTGEQKGAKMPTKPKGKAGKAKPAAKAKSNGGERATEAQLDKLSAQVVKLRDTSGKSWNDICEALDIQPSRARQLYNRGGGEPTRQKAAGTKKGAAGKTAAKGRGKGKRNPS